MHTYTYNTYTYIHIHILVYIYIYPHVKTIYLCILYPYKNHIYCIYPILDLIPKTAVVVLGGVSNREAYLGNGACYTETWKVKLQN